MNIEQEIQTIKDELEIRNLAGRFSDAANRRDFAAFGKLWTTDGKWQVLEPFPFHAEGAANIQSKIGEMIGQFRVVCPNDARRSRRSERRNGDGTLDGAGNGQEQRRQNLSKQRGDV